jgi:hypothetical protein
MKQFTATLFKLTVLSLAGVFVLSTTASAASFNKNRIMDDSIFENANSMSAGAIDNFLNSFPNSCISPSKGFAARVPNGYSPNGGYTYGGNGTAGQVIATAAQTYGINPQVLLTTLQKEQSLVSGAAGCSTNRIAKAAGYGCPDSGGSYSYTGLDLYTLNGNTFTVADGICVNSAAKAGFSQQIIRAAWMLKFSEQRSKGNVNWAVIQGNWDNSDDPQSCYSGYMTQGTWARCPSGGTAYYDGFTTIDNQSTYIGTGATAALYRYTPHFSGNSNFFTIFTGWFGSTTTEGFVWQFAGQSAWTNDTKTTPVDTTNLIAGQRVFVQVRATNSGAQTWNRGNIFLGTSAPNDRRSAFYDPSWYGPSRAATLDEATVAPGQTGTFSFWVTASQAGSYKEYFNLLSEGVTWMNELGLHFYFGVRPPTYTWEPAGQAFYTDSTKATPATSMVNSVPGKRYYVKVWAKNTGNQPWRKGIVNIGNQRGSSLYDGTWLSGNRLTTLHESVVNPGDIGSFEFWINTPNRTGVSMDYFNLVADGIAWMNDWGMNFGVTVNPAFTWAPAGQAVYTDSTKSTPKDQAKLVRDGRYYMVIKMRNIGTQTWLRGQVNLAATWPKDRDSVFYDSRWLSRNRPATLTEPTVAPGDIGTFEFWVTATNRPGFYKEYFNPVAEGITWFNDLGLHYPYTVHWDVPAGETQ